MSFVFLHRLLHQAPSAVERFVNHPDGLGSIASLVGGQTGTTTGDVARNTRPLRPRSLDQIQQFSQAPSGGHSGPFVGRWQHLIVCSCSESRPQIQIRSDEVSYAQTDSAQKQATLAVKLEQLQMVSRATIEGTASVPDTKYGGVSSIASIVGDLRL